MAVEKLTEQQKSVSNAVEDSCTQSLTQKAEQDAADEIKKAKEILDKSSQALAKIPEQAVVKLNDAIELLMSIITGHTDVNAPTFDPDALVAQIESLLNPVLKALSALPIPSIPGLAQIAQLLAALKELISSTAKGNDSAKAPSAEIPPTLMATLRSLLNSLLTLCMTLPLVLINLIFQMLNVIIDLFKQIAGIIGVPSIPFPLSLVPNCISMIPDMMNFMMQCPGKIYDTAYGTLKKAYGQIANLQVPAAPDDIKRPESLATCSQHAE